MSERTISGEDVRCQCCGVRAGDSRHPITVTYSMGGEFIALCSFCEGLIGAGMLRREYEGGKVRYRQMHPQPFKPGKLLPAVEQ